jgi:hypothetical protein
MANDYPRGIPNVRDVFNENNLIMKADANLIALYFTLSKTIYTICFTLLCKHLTPPQLNLSAPQTNLTSMQFNLSSLQFNLAPVQFNLTSLQFVLDSLQFGVAANLYCPSPSQRGWGAYITHFRQT